MSRHTYQRSAAKMQVIFDNGGGVTLQTAEFAHHYQDGKQVAEDVKGLLDGGTTRDWEGNEPEARVEVDQDTIRNGGYVVYDAEAIRETLKAGEIDTPWANVGDFFRALGVYETKRPMPKFTVCYEARQQGAIGGFYPFERNTEAEDATAALELVRAQLNREGFETRSPLWVRDDSRKQVL